jgi:uncharacterized protein (TIGR03067 family)
MFQAGQTAPPVNPDAKKALDQVQGPWIVLSMNGQDVPNGADFKLVFTGDKYESWVSGQVDERGTVKIDPSTKPASIDFAITEGGDAGKLQLGLMEVAGDTLSLAFAVPGNPVRPKVPADAALNVTLKKGK